MNPRKKGQRVKFSLAMAVFLLFFIFFPPFFSAEAQSFGETLEVSVSPQYPSVGERVFFTAKSVARDLNTTQITWSLDGRVAKQGIGEKNFDFTVGKLGSVYSLTVSAGGLSKNIVIRPTEVDLIWETDSYTPPFYKGKALRPFQGNVRFVAIPHFVSSGGVALDAKKLVYTWRNSGVLNPSASGFGRNSLSYSGALISRPLRIEVEVSSQDGGYRGRRVSLVEEVGPSVLLYEDHPLYGTLFGRALAGSDTIELPAGERELKISAVPYFFSADRAESKLKYSWSVNGVPLGDIDLKDSATFRQEGSAAGISRIFLSVENSEEFTQNSSSVFNLRFGEEVSGEGANFNP